MKSRIARNKLNILFTILVALTIILQPVLPLPTFNLSLPSNNAQAFSDQYTYVSSYTINNFGSVTNFPNAQSSIDSGAFATISESNLPSQPANQAFNTDSSGWTSLVGGADSNRITNSFDNTTGNTSGSGAGSIKASISGSKAGAYSGNSTWQAPFTYYDSTPYTVTLSFASSVTQYSTNATPNRYTFGITNTSGVATTIYGPVDITGTTSWNNFTATVPPSVINASGTYTLYIFTELSTDRSNGTVVGVNYDDVSLDFRNYRYDVELTTNSVPAGNNSLELSYKTNGENALLYVYDGSTWNQRATLNASTWTTYTYQLTSQEYNGGNVRIRYVDATQSSDNSQSSIDIDYQRIRTRAPSTLNVNPTNIAPPSVQQGDANVPMERLGLSVDQGSATWRALRINRFSTGSSVDSDISAVKLYSDTNNSNTFDAGDTSIGSGIFSSGFVTVTLNSPQVISTNPITYFVVYDFSPSPTVGDKVGAQVTSSSAFVVDSPDIVSSLNIPFNSTDPTIQATASVAVSLSPSSQSANPGQSITYTVVATNTGSTTDTITLSQSNSNTSYFSSALATASFPNVPIGQAVTTTLWVTPTIDVPALATNNTVVTATSTLGAPPVSTTATTTANQIYGLSSWISSSGTFAAPGTPITYTVTVTNTGNGTDSFSLNYIDTDPTNSFTVQHPISTISNLPAGSSSSLPIVVTPNVNASNSVTQSTQVNIASLGDPSKTSSQSETTIVNIVRNVSLTITPGAANTNPGSPITYTVEITNTGNTTDTISLAKSDSDITNFSSSMDLSDILNLRSGSSIIRTLTVTPNVSAGAGITASTSVIATSGAGSGPSSSDSVSTTVNQVYSAAISSNPDSGSPGPGTPFTYTLTITNTGNGLDTINLAKSDSNTASFTSSLSSSSVTLARDQSTTLSLYVTPNPGTLAGITDNTTITTRPHNGTQTSNAAVITTTVATGYGLALAISPPSASIAVGYPTTYTVAITNTGNATDTVSLTTSDSDISNFTTGFITNTIASIGPTTAVTTSLVVTPNVSASIGLVDTTTAQAISQGDPTKSAAGTVSTTAIGGNADVSYQDKTPIGVNQGQQNVWMGTLSMQGSKGPSTITGITVGRTGTSSDQDVTEVKVLLDSSLGNAAPDPVTDTVLGTGRFQSGIANVSFGSLSPVLTDTTKLFILYSISSNAQITKTVGLVLTDTTFVQNNGTVSGVFPITSTLSTIYPAGYDFTPPSPPTNLQAVQRGRNMVKLSWSPASDSAGVVGYTVEISFAGYFTRPVYPGAKTSWIDVGLAGSTNYQYRVKAYDENGNVSAPSNVANAAMPSSTFNPHASRTVLNQQGTCSTCHDVYGSSNAQKPRVDLLCYTCHDGTGSDYRPQQEFNPSGDGTALTPGSGRTSYHKIYSPSFATEKYNDVYCTECHNNHGYLTPGPNYSIRLLKKLYNGATSTELFCYGCHSSSGDPIAYNESGEVSSTYSVSVHKASISQDPSGSGNNISCLNCHGPHASDAEYLAGKTSWTQVGNAKTLPASRYGYNYAEENLCLSNGCHDSSRVSPNKGWNVYNQFNSGSSHPVQGYAGSLGLECASCHNVHVVTRDNPVSEPTNTRNIYNYVGVQAKTDYCLTCHDGSAPSGTVLNPSAARPYTITMNYASSDKSAYYRSSGHGNDSINQACDDCHNPHGSANPKLITTGIGAIAVTGNNLTLCQGCHNDPKGPYPATDTERDLTGYFTTGRWPGMSVYTNTQYSPHYVSANMGLGYQNGDCKNCHDVHGTDKPYDMLRYTYSRDARDMCFSCHSAAGVAAGRSKYNIEQYYKATDTYAGHKVQTTTSAYLVSGSALPCYDCHMTHGSANNNQHLLSDQRASNVGDTLSVDSANRTFCLSCHVAADDTPGSKRVEGIAMKALPDTPGTAHKTTDTSGCSSCHKKDYAAGGNNVHDPIKPAASNNCDSCHADKATNMLATSTNQNTSYHPEKYFTNTNGDCVQCHADHPHNTAAGMMTTTYSDEASLCLNCHNNPSGKSLGGVAVNSQVSSTNYGVSAHTGTYTKIYPSTRETTTATPYIQNCTRCHGNQSTTYPQDTRAPHYQSTTDFLLTQTEEQLCYTCHDSNWSAGPKGWNVYQQFQSNSKHDIANMVPGNKIECSSCHGPHVVKQQQFAASSPGSGSDIDWPSNTKLAFESSSTTKMSDFCLNCHSATPPTYANTASTFVPFTITFSTPSYQNKATYWTTSGHGSSTAKTDCDRCHNPHGSANPKLITNSIGSYQIAGNNNSLCQGCHDAKPASYPAQESNRDSAGYFTTGRWPGFASYTNAAYSPHYQSADIGLGYAPGDCKNCHDVHGTANKYDMLRYTYTTNTQDMCWQCHGSTAPSRGKPNIQSYFTGTSTGHKLQTTSSPYLASGTDVPCYDCHVVHGSTKNNKKLLSDQRSTWSAIDLDSATQTRAYCLGCHFASDATTQPVVEGINMKRLPSSVGAPHQSATVGPPACTSCHGRDDYSSTAAYNVHNPGPGSSSGGTDCSTCHSSITNALKANNGYHHMITTTAAIYTATGANDATCLNTCHVDHDKFNGNKASNLRTTAIDNSTNTNPAAYNSDFSSTETSGGICISCHQNTQTKSYPQGDNTGKTITLSKTAYSNSAHNYVTSSAFGDNTQFQGNCAKCHNDNTTKDKQTSNVKFAVHTATYARIMWTQPEEPLCNSCHGTGNGKDQYGTPMPLTSSQVGAQFGSSYTYAHPITATPSAHRPTETESSSFAGANRHVECADCHAPHELRAGNHNPGSNTAGNVITATWGIAVSYVTPTAGQLNTPTYTVVNPIRYEYELCFKCHSSWAYGGTPPNTPSGDGKSPPGAAAQTDISKEVNPYNYSAHAVIGPGKNQPGAANPNFTSTFVNGFTPQSTVTCSDCHASDVSGDPRGTHGSHLPYILRKNESGAGDANVFCFNCHNETVYDRTATNTGWSRYNHTNKSSTAMVQASGNLWGLNIFCFNCHGGNKVGSIHGTNDTLPGGNSAVRFMNGANMSNYDPATGTCTTASGASTYQNCTQHGNGTSFTPNYSY